jgi:uncharacterized phage protein (TIGR02218 family)
MKTPAYETSTGALAALLVTRQFGWCGLYKITLLNGAGTLYYSTADVAVTFGGNTYLSSALGAPAFERKGSRAKMKWRLGVEVDTLQFDVLPNGAQINGQDFNTAVKQGVFDGADVTFYHAYWPQQAYTPVIAPTGVVTMFVGRVAPVKAGRVTTSFTINSYLDLLNQNIPRNIYQTRCINTLYDGGCTLNQASFAVSGAVLTGSTASIINATIANATGYFDFGKIIFTSGANNGISRSIKQYVYAAPSTIALMSPLPNAPAIGDTFSIYAGCDKLQKTCSSKFSNLANFRGMPYIPENSTGV